LLLNNLGDIQWHYAYKSIRNAAGTRTSLSAQNCKFSTPYDFIYVLLLEHEAQELSLMKLGYDKGAVQFIRKIPGTFYATYASPNI
jgi:hypothetical protein